MPLSPAKTQQVWALRSERQRQQTSRNASLSRLGSGSAVKATGNNRLPWPVSLFILSLFVPWIITIGDIRMSAYRIILILVLIPSLLRWATGRAGKNQDTDLALLIYSLWCTLSLLITHGVQAGTQPGGILVIETVSAYFVARCYIRSADDFYNVALLLFRIFICVLPFAVAETLTGRPILLEFF